MKTSMPIASLTAVLLLVSCAPAPSAPTPDVVLIQTSAAQTVVANFTLTAAALTPTALPPATDTPTLQPQVTGSAAAASTVVATATLLPGGVTATPILCDALGFDVATVDVNVPDNTEMQLGQQFVKTWRVKNNGSCTWGAGYKIVYGGYADTMSGVPQAFNSVVAPGQEVEISVNFTAPTKPGIYLSAWQMANASGKPFPKPVFVKIVVK